MNFVPLKPAKNMNVNIITLPEEELKTNIWLVDVLQNKLKKVFMTPSIIVDGSREQTQAERIFDLFNEGDHIAIPILMIPSQILEFLVDNEILVHVLFLKSSKDPNNRKVTVILNKLEISSSANSDAEPNPV